MTSKTKIDNLPEFHDIHFRDASFKSSRSTSRFRLFIVWDTIDFPFCLSTDIAYHNVIACFTLAAMNSQNRDCCRAHNSPTPKFFATIKVLSSEKQEKFDEFDLSANDVPKNLG